MALGVSVLQNSSPFRNPILVCMLIEDSIVHVCVVFVFVTEIELPGLGPEVDDFILFVKEFILLLPMNFSYLCN